MNKSYTIYIFSYVHCMLFKKYILGLYNEINKQVWIITKKLNIHIYGQTWYCSTISKGCYIKFWDIYLQKVTEKSFSPTFSWDYQCCKSAYCIVKIKDKSIQNTGLGLASFQHAS